MKKVTLFQSRNGGGMEHVKYEDDVILPSDLMPNPPERLSYIKQLALKNGVLIAAYPKSGTHWITNVVLRLRRQSQDEDISRWGFLEIMPKEFLEARSSGGVFTSHLNAKRMPYCPKSSNMKVVFIVRNPKDVAVSFYYHFKNLAGMPNRQNWDEFLKSFMDGEVPWGSIEKYLKSWQKEINENKDLDLAMFYFEEFVTDSFSTMKKLADFIGANKTNDELREIIEECSVDNLRANAEKGADIDLEPRDKDGNSVIYRKGRVGDWKDHFTISQNEMFDKYLQDNFAGSMFKFRFE